MKPRILIACEESDEVRGRFEKMGFDAWSCDLQPNRNPNAQHYQGNVFDIINDGWDAMIAHPPCTRLSKAGAWCWKFKTEEQKQAFDFVLKLWNSGIEYIAIENPIGWLNTNWMKPSQIVHPFYFGDPWMKETCFWLKNLPPLKYAVGDNLFEKSTAVQPVGNWVKPGNKRPHRRFDSVREGAGGSRKERSHTFPSIAQAMADQWGAFILEKLAQPC